jgi:hypothetical protein
LHGVAVLIGEFEIGRLLPDSERKEESEDHAASVS